MPRTSKRTTDKGSWSQEQLESAMKQVRDGSSIRSVSKITGIPFSSLQERMKKGDVRKPSLGRSTTFTTAQEEEMAQHVKLLANMFYGVSPHDISRAAFEFAGHNGIKHNFNRNVCMASRDW